MYVIRHGDVWWKAREETPLSSGLEHVCGAHDQLAVAWIDDRLLKMGSEKSVKAWLAKNGQFAIGDGDVLSVFFPVSEATVGELNNCLANGSRVTGLLDRLEAIGVADPSLFLRPVYPV